MSQDRQTHRSSQQSCRLGETCKFWCRNPNSYFYYREQSNSEGHLGPVAAQPPVVYTVFQIQDQQTLERTEELSSLHCSFPGYFCKSCVPAAVRGHKDGDFGASSAQLLHGVLANMGKQSPGVKPVARPHFGDFMLTSRV